ncbi:hypothetical protein C8J56DRAFT_896542 [Mycena floridula]|nr:hypothetical protein C8J56DRAFT_896542 [Mycena floridula]
MPRHGRSASFERAVGDLIEATGGDSTFFGFNSPFGCKVYEMTALSTCFASETAEWPGSRNKRGRRVSPPPAKGQSCTSSWNLSDVTCGSIVVAIYSLPGNAPAPIPASAIEVRV